MTIIVVLYTAVDLFRDLISMEYFWCRFAFLKVPAVLLLLRIPPQFGMWMPHYFDASTHVPMFYSASVSVEPATFPVVWRTHFILAMDDDDGGVFTDVPCSSQYSQFSIEPNWSIDENVCRRSSLLCVLFQEIIGFQKTPNKYIISTAWMYWIQMLNSSQIVRKSQIAKIHNTHRRLEQQQTTDPTTRGYECE